MTTARPLPDLDRLSTLHSEIGKQLEAYKTAESVADKTNALNAVAQHSSGLTSAVSDPNAVYQDFHFGPLGNIAVRIAIELRLFDQLSGSEGRCSEELAHLCNTDPALLYRILRALAALNIIRVEEDTGKFLHTPVSKIHTLESPQAYAVWMWDVMLQSGRSIGPYMDKYKKKLDTKTPPFSHAYGRDDASVFEIIKENSLSELFFQAMSGSSMLCGKEATETFEFDQLKPNADGEVIFVDVGGNRGQTLIDIKKFYPNTNWHMILEERQSVLDKGTEPGLAARTQPYDFFKESQPVKGAAAYFYQRIFHDWNDEKSRLILQSLKPAMQSHSRLLICDVVVPDHQPSPLKCLRDINMMLVGGMERSERQWRDLLESEGFSLVEIHGLRNINNSIIEATIQTK